MKRQVIKAGLKEFLKKTRNKGLEHYLKSQENPSIPIQKTNYENAEIIELNDASKVILFFRNEYPESRLNPTHVYHLIQLDSTKESAKRIGAIHFVLNATYPTWLTNSNATFNHKTILEEIYDNIFNNFKKEGLYEDRTITRTLNNLLKWEE
jgi:hypothetical protein